MKLFTCDSGEPGVNQKWVYDGFVSSDLMLRDIGGRVLSIKGTAGPRDGSILRVLHKDFSLSNGAQRWKLRYVS